jgi:peptide chain release factor 2
MRTRSRRCSPGEADASDTYLEIHAGAGGTESQDWAEMLQRMYQRWAEKRGYKVETGRLSGGRAGGHQVATLLVKGENAYGYAKTESGVHRLVRISPYDSSARRHTSFSSVWVYPVIDDNIDIEINPKRTSRSTPIAHRARAGSTSTPPIPRCASPTCHRASSSPARTTAQHKNRATAMNMLKARLYEANWRKREAAASGEYQAKTEIGWGHQIRSYVLQPYQMVKDLRTGVTSTPQRCARRRARSLHGGGALAEGDGREGRRWRTSIERRA